MGALPLLEFLLAHAKPVERKILEDAIKAHVWRGTDVFSLGAPPDPEGHRRFMLRDQAWQALTAILDRVLADQPRPTATALNVRAAWRGPFDLETLRGRIREVDWPTGRWGRFDAIEVDDDGVSPPGSPDAIARDFIARHPELSRRAAYALYRDQQPAPFVWIPRKVFETLDKVDNPGARKKPPQRL